MTRRGGLLLLRREMSAQDHGDGFRQQLARDRRRIADLARRLGIASARRSRMLAQKVRP